MSIFEAKEKASANHIQGNKGDVTAAMTDGPSDCLCVESVNEYLKQGLVGRCARSFVSSPTGCLQGFSVHLSLQYVY